ncbi:MAG: sigma 54-interacting transcriptional regulator [Heliobacteriaceae bacterium]|nr:sigma 54-interacting transcriptional regulator [Heliobacteriaceae bacterium]MDD4588101.1 sigma 54-interacting transcriptional regulator [Heliobacteriaceae bacterium]
MTVCSPAFPVDCDNLLEALAVGVFITDGNGMILHTNNYFEKITMLKRADIIGTDVRNLVNYGYISSSVVTQVLKEERRVNQIVDYKTPNDVIVTGSPIFDSNGKIKLVVCTLKDWDELTALREEILAIIEQSQQCQQHLEEMKQAENTDLVFRDKKTRNVLRSASQVAKVDCTVLILGESGVGKDVLADYIHKKSSRAQGNFIHVNCGAIPEALFESELFGYAAGAFTGANREGKPGLFELANHGTIYLDEIAELPLPMQVKLLTVLQEKKVMRVGDVRSKDIDIRIVAATNQDIKKMVEEGTFREDLYYRLNVVQISIPPLRERKYDIPVLVTTFVNRFNTKYNQDKTLSLEVMDAFMEYVWPGNVRELEHTIERVIIMCPENVIRPEHLPKEFSGTSWLVKEAVRLSDQLSLKAIIEKIEKAVIYESLKKNRTLQEAAQQLRIDVSTLTRKKQKHGLYKTEKSLPL